MEIVFTGGPSAGKTTIISRTVEDLQEEGLRVIAIPEVATMLFSRGIGDMAQMAEKNRRAYEEIEKNMLLLQRDLRKRYREIARALAPEKVCLIYDRGEMDVASYLEEGEAHRILVESGEEGVAQSRDSYDCVIYLRSSALLGEEFYGTNNPARIENASEAIESDEKVLRSWLGHPHLWVVEADPDLEKKYRRVMEILKHSLGIPHAMEIERKFLLEKPNFQQEELQNAYRVEIEQTYLLSPEGERRVRRRSCRYGDTYHWTKKVGRGVERSEEEALIEEGEYRRFLLEADPDKKPLRKTRYHLVWAGRHYEIDHFHEKDIWIMEVELLDQDEEITLPPFLSVQKEVTEEDGWSSRDLAS